MKISPLTGAATVTGAAAAAKTTAVQGAAGSMDFSKGLTSAINNLTNIQDNADQLVTQMATGQNTDIQQVVLAVEKANMALQTSVQVKNKVVDAYTEIMHMQV